MKNKTIFLTLLILPALLVFGSFSKVLSQAFTAPGASLSPQVSYEIFEATQDTYVASSWPDDNNGDYMDVVVSKTATNEYQTLIDFDLSSLPPDAVIISATLKLTVHANQVGAGQAPQADVNFYADAIDDPWDEMVVTWNNKPTSTFKNDPPTPLPSSYDYIINWDVSNIVQAWENLGLSNHGILLRSVGTDAQNYWFYAKEYGPLNPPKLKVAFTSGYVGGCPGTIKVYADKDTYTDNTKPYEAFGASTILKLHNNDEDDTHKYLFFHFPVNDYIDQNQYIYDATLYWRDSDPPAGTSPPPYTVLVYTLNKPFYESQTNWLNQPHMYLLSGSHDTKLDANGARRIEGLRPIVHAIHHGSDPNHGIGVMLMEDDLSLFAKSRESVIKDDRPYLLIKCGSDTPTPLPPTNTPTFTPTPTNTPVPVPATVNFQAIGLRVVQSVQGRDNDVPLIEGRRTFVIFPVEVEDTDYTEGERYLIDAELKLSRDGQLIDTLLPINSPNAYLNLPIDPDWLLNPNINHVFLFEIPSQWRFGTLELEAEVNRDWKYDETYWLDNDAEAEVTFEPARRDVGMRVYRMWIEQDANNGPYAYPAMYDTWKVIDYAEQVLPFSITEYEFDIMDEPDGDLGIIQLDRYDITNLVLGGLWNQDRSDDATLFQENHFVRYFGLYKEWNADWDLVVGGRASDIPGHTATGHIGNVSTFAHELGHTFGRFHSQCCDAAIPCDNFGLGEVCWYDGWFTDYEDYPYSPDCIIGGTGYYPVTYQGFKYDPSFALLSYNHQDLMGYCHPRWMSDFTWKHIMNYLGPKYASTASTPGEVQAPADHLYVAGIIALQTNEVSLLPMFVIPNSETVDPSPAGDFAIVLRDQGGDELVRHAFTPGIPLESTCSTQVEPPDHADFSEMVAYDPNTASVEIEAFGSVLESYTVSASDPVVNLTYPNGGELVSSDTITLTWSASDPDGDTLYFNVQYSPDNGNSWESLAGYVTGNSAVIDTRNLNGSDQALIKVTAFDGFNTASDVSNATFTVPNHAPIVEIAEPLSGTVAVVGQTLGLRAHAYDPDDGSMDDTQLEWRSSIDGLLGNGVQLSLADLSVGTHTILFLANDGDGALAADSIKVHIYARPEDLPPLPDSLTAGPTTIVLHSTRGPSSATLYLENKHNPQNPINWSASASDGWLLLSATSGSTPDTITISIDREALVDGDYTATITVTDTATLETIDIEVYLKVANMQIFLPVMKR